MYTEYSGRRQPVLPTVESHRASRSIRTLPLADSRRMSPVQVRPLGGALGCFLMILVSVVLSVLLTVGLNLLLR